ncbi:SCP domain-containing protein [Durusdinium trenchii]
MPFQMLYPEKLSPLCQPSSRLLPPEKRWFRSHVDGTRYYGPWPSVKDLLLRWSEQGGQLSGWVLNLGAGDGSCQGGDDYDPANCLVHSGWSGLQVEQDEALAAQVTAAATGTVRTLQMEVTPENAGAVAEAAADFGGRPDLLKLDLDHADCALLTVLLEAFEPLVLHLEINPLFPPPFVYREHWGGRNWSLPLETSHHLIGCSLQAMIDTTRKRWGLRALPEAYWLHHVEFENAVLVHPDAARALPQFQGSWAQSPAEIWDLYVAGYFCHPLRGILSMRESIADYDFRSWMDLQLPMAHRGARMQRFLQREWLKTLRRDKAEDEDHLPMRRLLNDTRLTVDRLVTRSSPSRRQELQREHEELRRDLEASTRSLEDRLRLVLDCQGPLHRALCIQELRHCELAVLMCRRLETLAEEEANWSMEYKSALMSEGRDMRKVKLKSETIVLRNRLHKLCFNSTGGRSLKEDMAWGALHAREIFTVTSARKEVECLRQKVAAATLAMHRDTHPKLDAINSERHAILKTVKEQVQEAQRILEEFATWASRVESSLVLFATSKPSWCALAAAEPSALIEEATRLRQVFNKIIQATKKKVPVPSKEAGPKRRPKSASQATNSGSKEEEEGRRGSF